MDFNLTEEQANRKKEYDAFFEEVMKNAPKEYVQGGFEAAFDSDEAFSFYKDVQKKLGEKGWLTMAWPKKYGGLEASNIDQLLFSSAAEDKEAPGVEAIGVNIFAPGLMAFGTEEQKERLLPPISKGETVYCQGWSEPDAGSDLANLSTMAIRKGDEYIVNGQKVWTSAGHRADYMYLLARTDPESRNHKGLSVFHLDMNTPGVTVRPLYFMNNAHIFNEVIFKDVKIPKENRIGRDGDGWKVTMTSMGTERSGFFLYTHCEEALKKIIDYVKKTKRNGKYLKDEPYYRRKISEIYSELQGGKMLAYKIAFLQDKYGAAKLPMELPSESKVFGSELQFRVFSLASEIMGLAGTAEEYEYEPIKKMTVRYQYTAALATAMGTNEVQRNIIAWSGLKQPRLIQMMKQ